MGAPETEVINFQFLFHQNTVGSDKNESQVHMFYNQLFNIYRRCDFPKPYPSYKYLL